MYTDHFALSRLPFENVPDPLFFFDRGDFSRILGRMRDALHAGKGLLIISGPMGSGKTTLSQKLMADLPEATSLIWLAEPPKDSTELFLFLSQELGLTPENTARVFVLRDIRARLMTLRQRGGRCLMVIDESHLMSDEVLEGVRLLNNLEDGAAKLIQIILLGQEELHERISRPDLEAFRQRIAGLEFIGRMDADRVKAYIGHRLLVADAQKPIFTEQAVEAVAASTGGVPRVTNSLCDRALRVAYEAGKDKVGPEEVHQAASDLGLGKKTLNYLLELKRHRQEASQQPFSTEKKEAPALSQDVATSKPPPARTRKHPSLPHLEEVNVAPQEHQDTGWYWSEPEIVHTTRGPGLVASILFFASSVAALTASLWLYCDRAGSDCWDTLLSTFF